MQFINNWQRTIALSAGQTVAELELPDGQYRLTVSDALGAAATAWEYVTATVAGGVADLLRGEEGSMAREWPAGSVIYCSLTAGVLISLSSQIAALQARVSALEEANIERLELFVTVGLESFGPSSYEAGWSLNGVSADYGQLGAIDPPEILLPGLGNLAVWAVRIWRMDAATAYLSLGLPGVIESLPVATLDVQGVGMLDMSAATRTEDSVSLGEMTWFGWEIGADDWALGAQRSVTLTLV